MFSFEDVSAHAFAHEARQGRLERLIRRSFRRHSMLIEIAGFQHGRFPDRIILEDGQSGC